MRSPSFICKRLILLGAAFAVLGLPCHSQECFTDMGDAALDTTVSALPDSGIQPPVTQPRLRWHSMITNLPGDWMRGIKQATRVDNLPAVASLTAITIGLLASDKETYRPSGDLYQSSPAVHEGTDFFVSLGDTRSHMILAGGFAAYGLIASDQRSLATASQTVEAVLASGLVVQVLKRISGRESPEVATRPSGKWTPFPNVREYHQHQSRFYAFPSGHIATSMAVLTVLAENYSEVSWIRPVGYTVVGLIGVSLVNRGYHWYSDLPLGIAIGHAFGMIASHPEADVTAPATPSISVTPTFNGCQAGVQFALVF